MQTIQWGKTGARIPTVGVGTWGHGGAKVVEGRAVGWSGHDDDAARAALETAYRLGLTHWDTADVYGGGQAERLIGELWETIPRQEILLASKVGWWPGDFDHAYHPKNIRRQAEASLANLRTESIDLYYFHRCDFGEVDEYFDDAMEAFLRLREEGKIRWIGLSDWSAEKLLRYAERMQPDVLQPYRNVLDDDWQESGLAAWAEEHEVGVAFFSPLKHGLLLGKYDEPPELGEGDHRRSIPAFTDPDRLAHFRRFRVALEERFGDRLEAGGEPVLHALIGALLADTPNACVLLGMRRPAHAEAAARVGEALSAEEADWVREQVRDAR